MVHVGLWLALGCLIGSRLHTVVSAIFLIIGDFLRLFLLYSDSLEVQALHLKVWFTLFDWLNDLLHDLLLLS